MSGEEPDFEGEGLLGGLEGEAREARLELLGELHEDGVSVEELREAIDADRLAMLPVERVWEREIIYTAEEVSSEAGVERELLERLWKALGMALTEDDEVRFTEGDRDAAHRVGQLREAGIPEEAILEVARVIGLSLSQVAAAIRGLGGQVFVQAGDTERDAGLRLAGATEATAPLVGPILENTLRLHLREQMRRDVISRAQLAAGGRAGDVEVAVSFVDMVDFTGLGESIPASELGNVTGRLAAIVADAVAPPVRLVKMIGDAAMLVSREPQALVETVLALVEAGEAEGPEFPALRGGIAAGEATSRGGDWFGRPVNTASRVAGAARPSSVLATDEVLELVDAECFRWSDAGSKSLKGIGDVHVLRVRTPEPEAEGEDGG